MLHSHFIINYTSSIALEKWPLNMVKWWGNQGGKIPQGVPTHKFAKLLNKVVMRGHVNN